MEGSDRKSRFVVTKVEKKVETKKVKKKQRKRDTESLRINVLKGNARETQKKVAIDKVLDLEERLELLNLDIIQLDEIRFKKKKEILKLNKELIRMTKKYKPLFPGRT
jgi:hypothetical protein